MGDTVATLVTWAGAAGTALIACVGILWRDLTKKTERTEMKLDRCEEKHDETNQRLIALNKEVGLVKGRQEGIEILATRVLDAVANTKNGTSND